MLGVGDGVTDDVLKEDLEDTTGLLVDEARDALDATPASQPTDGRLGDALDVVPKNLAVPLGSTLSESLSSFSASCKVGGRWARGKDRAIKFNINHARDGRQEESLLSGLLEV